MICISFGLLQSVFFFEKKITLVYSKYYLFTWNWVFNKNNIIYFFLNVQLENMKQQSENYIVIN